MSYFYKSAVNITEGFFSTPQKKENRGSPNPETGYYSIKLCRKNCKAKNDYVHRCIWREANRCEIPPGFVVHHIDNDKSNNKITNLSLCSQYYNVSQSTYKKPLNCGIEQRRKYATGKNLRCSIVAKSDIETTYESMRQASIALGINISLISNIVNNKKYCHTSKSKIDNKRYTFFRTNKCSS